MANPNPPMSTRSAAKKATMNRVLKDVMDLEDSDIIVKAIESQGIKRIEDLLSLSESNIDDIFFDDLAGNQEEVPAFQKNLLKVLKEWNFYIMSNLGIRKVDWDDPSIVNYDDFNDFRVTAYNPDQSLRQTVSRLSKNTSSSVPSSNRIDTVQDFRKGIKRDKSHYAKLRDERFWDDWKRKTEATVSAHGCDDVIDITYNPSSPSEIDLFKEKKKFMYDVFNDILLTDMGKHFVRVHSTTKDAQAVWKDYLQHMSTSTKADIEVENLLSELTNERLDPRQESHIKFIINWMNKLRRYEDMTPLIAHFPEAMKKSMLRNAINHIKIYNDIKVSEEIDVAKGNASMNYQEYLQVVQRVASGIDERNSKRRRSFSRQANIHSMDEYIQGNYEDDEYNLNVYNTDIYDLYQPFESLEISAAEQGNRSRKYRRPSLKKATWQSLTKEDQATWDNISDQGKRAIIFAHLNHPKEDNKEVRFSNIKENSEKSKNEFEIFQSGIQDGDTETMENQDDDLSSILVKAATTGRASPKQGSTKLDIRQLMSNDVFKKKKKVNSNINVDMTDMTYHVSKLATTSDHALVDRGANGGIAGENVRVISRTDRTVNVTGVDNHQITDLQIVTAGGIIPTQRGEVIAILHQYAHNPMGKTIHSSIQLEHFKNAVDDRSSKIKGATQSIRTLDGYVIPLRFKQGLAYMPIRPYSNEEWKRLPHIVLTSDEDWDPSKMDQARDEDEWLKNQPENPTSFNFRPYNHVGDYFGNTAKHESVSVPLPKDWATDSISLLDEDISTHVHEVKENKQKFEKFRPYFLHLDPKLIKLTFENTTQFARTGIIKGRIYDTHKSPFPALNVRRRNEPVATDTVFADVPSFSGGYISAQFFVGCHTSFATVHGMQTDSQFVSTLQDEIRKRGAMDKLVSDRAQVEISNKVHDILRHLCIDDWQSEPHYQHQNFAERRYREVKHKTNRILNETGASDEAWFHCMKYVTYILNRMALKSLKWKTPYEKLFGQTPDISMIYRFQFWERVYYPNQDSRNGLNFPSSSDEKMGRFIGFSESVGHPMTYIIWCENTRKIIYRSRLRASRHGENFRIISKPENNEDNDDDVYDYEILERKNNSKNQHETPSETASDSIDRNENYPKIRNENYMKNTPTLDDDDDVENEFRREITTNIENDSEHGDNRGNKYNEVIKSKERPMAKFDPDELIGRSYIS